MSGFTEALARGAIAYQRCERCGCSQLPARNRCQACHATELTWCDACGAGTVWSITVVHRAPDARFRALVPYSLAIVELVEGPRVMGLGHASLAIGDRVRCGVTEIDGLVLAKVSSTETTAS